MIVSLIVYALALPKVGFMITTFLMCLYLVILFSVNKRGSELAKVLGKNSIPEM